ncbi:hypothetical protein OIM90_07305 [Streptomyces sp. AD16]|nr:hypothetical protein NQP46_25125 [Streptomyces albus]WDV31232.1 hypothetical protein OIM90_07305 [Streptomyces sp. AD16]
MSRLPAACLHTHLFRGARVLVDGLADPSGYARAPRPLELALRFSDDAPADAQVLVSPSPARHTWRSARTRRRRVRPCRRGRGWSAGWRRGTRGSS